MMKESEQMRVTKKIKEEQLKRLSEVYHDDGTMLHFTSPFTLLVAVILSAQCTDKRVNVITGRIFPRLASPEKMGALRQEELENEIRDCGLYKAKAKNLLGMCHMLIENYGGGPVGMDTLAAAIAEARDAVEDVIEPYLLQQGFIQRTPRGRMATERAYRHLKRTPPASLNNMPEQVRLFDEDK